MRLEPAEQTEFQQIVVRDRQYRKVETMITTYEQKGKLEEKHNDLIMLMEKKFRKLKAAEKNRIRKIESYSKLDQLLLSLLDADSLAELDF
jgi:hypothetical protein